MKDKIRKIWVSLDSQGKSEALSTIKKSFNLKSETAIRQRWMYQGEIPSNKEARTLLLIRGVLKKQLKRLERLI